MFSNFVKRCIITSSSTINNKAASYSDIIICGGGLIGTTMACALAMQPSFKDKSILLVESSPQHGLERSKTYSNRVSAISPFSKNLFERLEIWRYVQRYQKVTNMNVWGLYSDSFLELNNHDKGIVAHIVENGEIIQAVSQVLSSLDNVKVIYQQNISNVIINRRDSVFNEMPGLPKVVLENGSEHLCKLLIGADGVNSMVRKAMGVDYLSWNYNQMAVVATLNISECTNTTAWQRFLPDGPVALLPLNKCFSSLVWSTKKEKAQNLLKIPTPNFVDALDSAIRSPFKSEDTVKVAREITNDVFKTANYRLPNIGSHIPDIIGVVDNSRAAFPLGFGHAVNYVLPNVVLIGDAAHRIHPLAGQGVNLGFRDIDCLQNILCDSIKNGKELGNMEDLKKHETICQKNNIPVMAFVELVHRMYTSHSLAGKVLCDFCLQFASSFDIIKEHINKKALFSSY